MLKLIFYVTSLINNEGQKNVCWHNILHSSPFGKIIQYTLYKHYYKS